VFVYPTNFEKAYDRLEYTKEDMDRLIREMKAKFIRDDDFDVIERSIFLGFKHILA